MRSALAARFATAAATLACLLLLVSTVPASAVTTDPMLPTTYSNALGRLPDWDALGRRDVSTDAVFVAADVWVYGDSITRSGWLDLRTRLGSIGLSAAVDAQASVPTTPQVARLAQRVARQQVSPRVLVMALGTNDIYNPIYVREAIRQTRAAVGPRTRILWVGVHAKVPAWTRAQESLGKSSVTTINGAIAAARTVKEVDETVNWNGAVTRLTNLQRVYLTDGIHTTTRGLATRNSLIVASVRRLSR